MADGKLTIDVAAIVDELAAGDESTAAPRVTAGEVARLRRVERVAAEFTRLARRDLYGYAQSRPEALAAFETLRGLVEHA